jgi:PAS domain S-box-containing protein
MENLLIQSETRLRSIIASQTAYYIVTDLQGKYTFCNPKFINEFGWLHPTGAMIGQYGMDSIMPYHHQRVEDTVMKCFAAPNVVFQVEVDKPGKNNTVKNTLWDFVCLTDDLGIPEEIQCCGIDISDRIRAEKKLKEQDMRLKQAQALAHIGSWELNLDTQEVVMSEELCRVFGIPTDDNKQSLDVFLSFVHPDDSRFVTQSINDSIASMQDASFDNRIIRKDGIIRYIHSESRAEINAEGKPNCFYGTTQDITELKGLEIDLSKSEANLRSIFENTDVGFLFLSPQYEVLAFNKISIQWAAKVFGIQINSHSNFRELLLPKSLAEFDAFARGILEGNAITYETSYPKADHTLMWFTVGGRPVTDHGNIAGICIAITDITARKESEDEIAKISNLNAFIGQVNQNIVHIKDKKDLFKNACRIACEFGKFKIAWIGIFDEEHELINLVDQTGLPDSQLQHFTNAPLKPDGPQKYLLQNGGYYVSNNSENDPGLQSMKALGDHFSFRSCMLLAIKKADKVIGTFNLYSTEVGFFDPEKITLLQEVTSDISFALDMFEKADRQKEAEEQIIKNEKRFRALIEKSTSMKTLATAEGEVIYGSPSISDILGYSPAEFMNKPGIDFIHPDDIAVFQQKRKDILKTPGASFHLQQRLRHKDGHWLWCEDTDTNMLHDPDVNAIISNFTDITERKNAEDKTEANKALEAFTGMVSHDLRAPARAVVGFAKIIQEEYSAKMCADERELFGYIEDGGKRMNILIDDLLKLAKNGNEKLKLEPVDMKRLIGAIWLNISRNVAHQAVLELKEMPVILADESMMHQVVENLLTNAIKYSSKKEKPVITIWCEEANEKVTFYFKDNGAGFDMNQYYRLYGAFQRLHNQSDFEGTGVGLSLVKRIIEKHGGTVGAESKVGEGATFYFSLPALAAKL